MRAARASSDEGSYRMRSMNKRRFAEPIGVSHQMVSKYAQAGSLVCDEHGIVQVSESLSALEGKLEEDKLQRALSVVGSFALSPPPSRAPRPKRT